AADAAHGHHSHSAVRHAPRPRSAPYRAAGNDLAGGETGSSLVDGHPAARRPRPAEPSLQPLERHDRNRKNPTMRYLLLFICLLLGVTPAEAQVETASDGVLIEVGGASTEIRTD